MLFCSISHETRGKGIFNYERDAINEFIVPKATTSCKKTQLHVLLKIADRHTCMRNKNHVLTRSFKFSAWSRIVSKFLKGKGGEGITITRSLIGH